jgi:nucleoside-diphosphate-sugar epimerase
MAGKVIVVTGASGFIGSSLVVALSKAHIIIAIDKRRPSSDLVKAAPDVQWEILNIADATVLNDVFRKTRNDHGRIDFVIHLAAFYHFGNDWRDEYEQSNITGTKNILNAAIKNKTGRMIFASSVAAMEPPLPGSVLNEKSSTSDYIPYARSKSAGEKLIKNSSNIIPAVVLRLGGVYSDWCELPPLYSLIRIWSGNGPFSMFVPGKGETGIPYIHLSDVIQVIDRCIQLNDQLEAFEILIASQNGAVMHNELFSTIKKSVLKSTKASPIHLSPALIKPGFYMEKFFRMLRGKASVEQSWMLKYIDRPWIIDNTLTQQKLNWEMSADAHILRRIPEMLKRYKEKSKQWDVRYVHRIMGNYIYRVEDISPFL